MFKVFVITAALAVSTLAQAQTAASAAPAGTAKKELVARVLELQKAGIENFGNSVAAAPLMQMRQQIGPILQQRVPEDRREAVARDIEADMKNYFEEISALTRQRAVALAPGTLGAVLAERFSEDELKQIVTSLESSVQRRFQTTMAEVQRTLGERLVSDTRGTIEPKLRALDQTISRRLGLTPAAAAASGPKK